MRTQEEILARIEERKRDDFFGFECGEYIKFLSFENAKPYLKEDVTQERWENLTKDKTPKQTMIEYMPFAWEKANNCRGISATRSICHYIAWLWLDGDEDLWPTLGNYQFYGKDQLIQICKYLNLDSSEWDDGIRTNNG